MDQNNGLEARTFKEEIRTILTLVVEEIPPTLIRISLRDPTSHMGIIVQAMEAHMTNAPISRSIEAMATDLEMDLLTIRLEIGEIMGIFLVLHRLKGETSHRIIHIANQEVISPATLFSADLTIDRRLVLHPMNKNSRKIITRPPLMWFASPQLMILLTNC